MEIEKINQFAKFEMKRKEDLFNKSNQEMILIDSLKLSEEVGEFMNEIQNFMGFQRKEKLDDKETVKKHLGEECADIILVASMLANRLDLNLEEILNNKMNIVKNRKY
jgi:NTP pyrophosphatase (non-canonical NTP hydrolase)